MKIEYIPQSIGVIDGREIFYDVFVPSMRTILEIDGPQHFGQVARWEGHEYRQERNVVKMNYAWLNGVHMIRLYQEDVWYDSYDWKGYLMTFFNHIGSLKCLSILCLSRHAGIYGEHLRQFVEWAQEGYNLEIHPDKVYGVKKPPQLVIMI